RAGAREGGVRARLRARQPPRVGGDPPAQRSRAAGERWRRTRVTTDPRSAGDGSELGEQDLFLFNEGSHLRLWEKLGSHPCRVGVRAGTRFAVWAPNARSVSVIGDWNGWKRDQQPLQPVGASGIWQGFVPEVG